MTHRAHELLADFFSKRIINFFGDVEFFKALPLIETLMDLSYAVQKVIGQFDDLVASRK